MGRSGRPILPLFDPNQAIAEMRLFKSAEEIDLLRKVSRMTALAHKGVMKDVRPGMTEADVETMINYYFRKEGCQRTSFGTIVAGGKNAACLHYTLNNEILRDGDLLLVDAGGEFEYYAGDISRTFPIGVRFSPAQAKVYDLVLKAQIEAVEMVRPGVTLAEIHQHVCDVMIEGCLSLGILKGKKDEILKTGAYKRVFPHNTSHWIGLDVHDVGLYLNAEGCPRKLEPGMCFSVEPGFYVQPADMETPSEYREIGIRIEDDILVTAKGHEVLTSDVPKTRSDIEALRS
jgi:Xaa-Pro aminopeptidase